MQIKSQKENEKKKKFIRKDSKIQGSNQIEFRQKKRSKKTKNHIEKHKKNNKTILT